MPKILCIDDHTHGLAARRIVLEEIGYTVSVSRNGRDGLESFQKDKADLVVVDYVMPNMNGGDVLREIKKLSPKTPVIILSGYTETMNLDEKLPEADCVMKKGAREVPELRNAIARLLRKSMKKPAASVKTVAKAKAKPDPKRRRK